MRKLLSSAIRIAALTSTLGWAAAGGATVLEIAPTFDRAGSDTTGDAMVDMLLDFTSTQNSLGYFTAGGFFGEEFRAGLEFDLAGVPNGATIDSATLVVTQVAAPIGDPWTLDLHGYSGDGVVDLNDFLTTNLIGGAVVNDASPLTFDVTAFLQGQVDANAAYGGFLLQLAFFNPAADQATSIYFSETGDPLDRPRLVVEYTSAVLPEPGSSALLGLGLLLLGSARRRGRT